jgi:hypothetical protein
MTAQKLTAEIIVAAIDGFEAQKGRIDAQIAELRAMLPGGRTEPVETSDAPKAKRRKMSAAARKRIGDAQRKRWAGSKGESESPSETITAKPKRKMSAAGKRAIAEATKKRWAAFHAAKKTAAKKAVAKAPAKKAAKKTTKKAAKAPTATPSVTAE